MDRKLLNILFVAYLSIGTTVISSAQVQTGAINGKVADSEGFSLPGAFIYLYSPALIGTKTYITKDTGYFKFLFLPPGKYRIMAEMPGFKTINIEDVIIRAGKTITLEVIMEPTQMEEEITVTTPTPTGDFTSAKNAVVIDKELLDNIPVKRDLSGIINSAPATLCENILDQRTFMVHGSSTRANGYVFAGMNVMDPMEMYPRTNFNYDVMEEVEVVTSAHPVEYGNIEGGFINVVPDSGSNNYRGEIFLFHTNDKLAQRLWSAEELDSAEGIEPILDRHRWDSSLSLGGPLYVDRIWFFTGIRTIYNSRPASFIPWSDPQNNHHLSYNWKNLELMGFAKLTGRVNDRLRVSANFHFFDHYRPVSDPLPPWNLTKEATQVLNHAKEYTVSGVLDYSLNQNTYAYVRGGFSYQSRPLHLNEEGKFNPQYYDEGTGHLWGSADFNEYIKLQRIQGTASITSFQDNVLGTQHELKAGVEYEISSKDWGTWKADNLLVYYKLGSPYFYGESVSPSTGETVGKGKISFYTTSILEEGLQPSYKLKRLGLFIQDSVTIANRLTLNLGMRYDRSNINMPAYNKFESGNAISLEIGEDLIEAAYEINPYGANVVAEWNNIIAWNSWSPRVSLTLDLLGNRKTLINASFSLYPEYLTLQYVSALYPLSPGGAHQFYWYDENMDSQVDTDDTFELFPEDYRLYSEDFFKKGVASKTKPPYTEEITVSLHQEFFNDFSVRVSYIHKKKKNIFENVLYSPESDSYWYSIEKDTESWWIPFNTIVPEVDEYPETSVTVYFLSKDAPKTFYQGTNVPELKRTYNAIEFVLKKRMSHNWQLFGSVLLSKAVGNIGLSYSSSSGLSSAADSPNYFVNLTDNSRLDSDRPVVIKCMGTYRFPLNFLLSFYYFYMSGTPWARDVTIIPPDDWAQQNNTYVDGVTAYLELPGTRRYDPINNLNFRIEKEFRFRGYTRLSAYVDIFNVLGSKYRLVSQNDGGYWYPQNENTNQGTRILSPAYLKTLLLSGARVFRFSISFNF